MIDIKTITTEELNQVYEQISAAVGPRVEESARECLALEHRIATTEFAKSFILATLLNAAPSSSFVLGLEAGLTLAARRAELESLEKLAAKEVLQ